MSSELEALQARIDAIGRPPMAFGNYDGQRARELSAWMAAYPELNAEWVAARTRYSELLEAEEKARAERHEAEWQRRQLEDAVGARNVAALDVALDVTEATRKVEEFIAGKRMFLLLTGSPGTGKSLAACVAVKRAIADQRSVVFARAVECTRMSLFDADDKAFVERLRRASLVVLDDLGVEGLHDSWRQTLEDVLDARYASQLDTVITTNLDPAAFKARYGDRIVDRIRHDGVIAQCGSVSLRKRPE